MLTKLYYLILLFLIPANAIFSQFFPDFTKFNGKQPNYYEYQKAFDDWAKDKDLDKVKGWKWYQRYLCYHENQINPNGSFPELRQNAQSYEDMLVQSKYKKEFITKQSGWVPLGPTTIGKCYDSISAHGNGRLNCVSFHPTDPDIMWVGAPNGGVWKTDNGGQSWRPLTDHLPSIGVSDIAVDPKNPDILYLASGDIDVMGWMSSSYAMGIFKSTDGGESWYPTGLSYNSDDFNFSYIRKILIYPDFTNNLVAAGSRGIWKSRDAGETWDYILDSLLICDLKQNPRNPNILYAATRWFYGTFSTSGVIKSTDFGETWTTLNTGIPPTSQVTRTAIAISPVNPDYIYAVAVRNQRNGFYGLYQSTDAGTTWTNNSIFGESPNILGWYDGDQRDLSGQGTYDLTIICDNEDENKIYVGGVNIWESTDAGTTWDIVTLWMKTFGPTIHADQHYSVYRPLDGYYYFCNDGGLFRTKKIQAGSKQWITDWIDRANENLKPGCPGFSFPTEWESLTEGLANTELYRLGLCRDIGGYISGGCQDNSCFYLYNDEWLNFVTNYDGMETMIHHSNPNIIYGSSQFGRLCKSEDATVNMDCSITDTITTIARERGSWVTPFAMDPVNPDIIYGGYKNLWRSNDGGKNWNIFFQSDSLSNLPNNINVIEIAPFNPEIICIAKPQGQSQHIPNELWITKDGGINWKKITEGLPVDTQAVVSIEISGDNPKQMWISFSSSIAGSKIYKSNNGGETWTNITYNLPNTVYNSVVHQNNNPKNFVYTGTYRGVWYTNDDLNEWILMNENLPNNNVNELEISYPDNKIIAATYGRGFWIADLIEGTVDIDDNSTKLNNISLTIIPNPSSGEFNLVIENINSYINHLKLEIINIFGNTIYTESLNKHSHSMTKTFNLDLPTGQYYLKISSANRMKVRKLVITK
jgi:photosystem II stability/assembly factor-like uncharacterized protein